MFKTSYFTNSLNGSTVTFSLIENKVFNIRAESFGE